MIIYRQIHYIELSKFTTTAKSDENINDNNNNNSDVEWTNPWFIFLNYPNDRRFRRKETYNVYKSRFELLNL